MKQVLILALSCLFITLVNTANAQTPRRQHVNKSRAAKAKQVKRTQVRRANRTRARRTTVVHYHYRHLPKRGAIVATTHTSAVTVRFGGINYRMHSGVWYKPHGQKWIVARPAVGIRINTLPVGYRQFVLGTRTYYYYYGTYYVAAQKGYDVVDAPLGAEIDSLPEGYQTSEVNGEDYYELDGVYYMPSVNDNGDEILVAVKNPSL